MVALAGSERLNALMVQVLAEMRQVFHEMAADQEFQAPYVEDNGRIAQLLGRGQRTEAADFMMDYLDGAEAPLLAALARRKAQEVRVRSSGTGPALR